MKKLIAVAIICLAAFGLVSAQDWRSDDENDMQFNCELVNALKDKAGAESLIRTEAGEQQSLAGFLDHLFPACARQDSLRLAELIDSEEEEWVVVLYDKVSHEWGEPECSILIDDFYDEHFTFIIGGHRLDGLALDVYLPGEDEAVDMDHVVEDMVRGVPVRYEVLGGNQFPLGQYVFDVHVDDDTFHFLWERTDNSMNTVSLSCLGREDESEGNSAAVAADAEAPDGSALEESTEAVIALDSHEGYRLEEEGCIFTVANDGGKEFRVSIIGKGQEGLSVDVYLPGNSEPLVMDGIHEYEEDIGIIIPARLEWVEGDSFPFGMYTFDVNIQENSYRFQWEREDDDYRSVALACFGKGALIPELNVLADNEKTFIPDTDCLIWTEAWDEDFNILIVGEKQDEMAVDLYFPGEDQPQNLDGRNLNEFDDGTPYRVEWIGGESFPLGLFNIDVTIEGQRYNYQWQREDHSVNTFGVECITMEDD